MWVKEYFKKNELINLDNGQSIWIYHSKDYFNICTSTVTCVTEKPRMMKVIASCKTETDAQNFLDRLLAKLNNSAIEK